MIVGPARPGAVSIGFRGGVSTQERKFAQYPCVGVIEIIAVGEDDPENDLGNGNMKKKSNIKLNVKIVKLKGRKYMRRIQVLQKTIFLRMNIMKG